jgi:hypothetical protein
MPGAWDGPFDEFPIYLEKSSCLGVRLEADRHHRLWGAGMRLVIAGLLMVALIAATSAAADDLSDLLGPYSQSHAEARASQPAWSSPLVTTTGLLEQRVRFDVEQQHAGNGSDTTELDTSRALDLILGDSNEIQVALPPYEIRHNPTSPTQSGYADGSVLRLEQRLASSPADGDDYVVTAWLQVQAPAGIKAYTSGAWVLQPTLAAGKGWGDFDVQATIGGVLPTSNVQTLGRQIQTNVAFQYNVMEVFWPELEVNWTYYAGGQRNALNQVYLTPGLVIGRFDLSDVFRFTFGLGYQSAVSPDYRPKPLTPSYNHEWIFSSRLNF